MSNNISPTVVTTGDVRLSYVHLFTPHAHQVGAELKYSVTILLPKSDIATKQRIDAAIQAAISQGVAGKWNGVRPAQVSNPIWDGDGFRKNGEVFSPECKGHWVFTASSSQKHDIVDINLNPIIDQTQVYSGMYARVNINFFPFFNSGNKGIGCGLGPVQKRGDGEPLGGRVTAEAAFGGGAPAYPQQPTQPVYTAPAYQQPQQPYVQQPQTHAPTPVQPGYQQPQYAPQQPVYNTQPQQFDPITGRPIVGGIMGL